MASLESPLEVENGLVEQSPEAHAPEELYRARTLIQDCWEVAMTVINVICPDQKLTKGSSLAHYEPVMLVNPRNVKQPQIQDTTPKFKDVIAAAKSNLSDAES
jgi:hypothetical protein